jgi:molybdenum cofactor cytidylyltransferase
VPPRITAIVLAAGRATRFGSVKVIAPLGGRPILEHVLARLRAAAVDDVVVVLGDDAAAVEGAVRWPAGVRRIVNPDPTRGLASSLIIGFAEARASVPRPDAILVALGDQPRTDPAVVRRLVASLSDPRPLKVPRYPDGTNPNPVLVAPLGYELVGEAEGDRGLGPVIARHPELVDEVAVDGSNADVDTADDLAALERTGTETPARETRHPVS